MFEALSTLAEVFFLSSVEKMLDLVEARVSEKIDLSARPVAKVTDDGSSLLSVSEVSLPYELVLSCGLIDAEGLDELTVLGLDAAAEL